MRTGAAAEGNSDESEKHFLRVGTKRASRKCLRTTNRKPKSKPLRKTRPPPRALWIPS